MDAVSTTSSVSEQNDLPTPRVVVERGPTAAEKIAAKESYPHLEKCRERLGGTVDNLRWVLDLAKKSKNRAVWDEIRALHSATEDALGNIDKALRKIGRIVARRPEDDVWNYTVRRADVSKSVDRKVFETDKRAHYYYRFSQKSTKRYENGTSGSYTMPKDTLYLVETPKGTHEIVSSYDWSEIERALNRSELFADAEKVLASLKFASKPDEKKVVPRVVSFVTYNTDYGTVYRTHFVISPRWKPQPDTTQTVVVAEKWANWGGIWAMTSTGVKHGEVDGLPITSLRALPEDPKDEDLAALRRARIELNESICAEAMKPARVEKMIEKYGMDWLDLA